MPIPVLGRLLPGKQTAVHTYVFLADEGFDDIASHKFRVELLTWSAGNTEPRLQQRSTIDFDHGVVEVMKGQGVTGVPFEEQRQRLRQLK